jgi:DNA-binding winged helix-turn-helix (wHTH) protein
LYSEFLIAFVVDCRALLVAVGFNHFALMTIAPKPSPVYRFGLFEAFPESAELYYQGRRVKIQDQPFRVLIALLEHPGEIVVRESLRQHLWPENTFVEFDQGLGTAVAKLRQALSDDANNPRFVETVPKRGFRFIAPVVTATPHSAESVATESFEPHPQPQPSEPAVPVPTQQRETFRYVGFAFLALILLAGSTLLLWNSRRGHALPKLGEKDTVVLTNFINRTGDPAFDDTLRRALAISLAQSPAINLLPEPQIAHTLRTMELPPESRLSEPTALELCQRAGGRALITGSISALGSRFVVGLDALDCQTGAVFAREQREAARKEEVLAVLGAGATSLRRNLGESLTTLRKFDVPLQQATTSSLEALKAYSTAWKVRDEHGDLAAIPYAQHAVDLDANFALAYGLLAQLRQTAGEDSLGAAYALKAYDLRARVTEPENFALTNFYLNFVRGDREAALQNCELWAATYPHDRVARICLFFDTEYLGRYEKSLDYGLDCIRVDPQTSVCYADLIYNYAILNRLPEAKAIYQSALALGLDHPDLHNNRYGIAFLESDAPEMSRQLAWGLGKPGAESGLLASEGETAAFYGHLRRANNLSRQAVDSASRAGQPDLAARLKMRQALREALFGDPLSAKQHTAEALKLASYPYIQDLAAVTLGSAGDTAQAEKIAKSLADDHPADTMLHNFWLPSIRAAVALQQHRPQDALESLRLAETFERGEHLPLLPAYLRGQALLALDRGPEAALEFHKLIDAPGIVQNSAIAALAGLGLARALSMASSHDTAAARAQYQFFLSLWKDADPELAPLQQAKRELNALH